jgi:hypothetical protein
LLNIVPENKIFARAIAAEQPESQPRGSGND